MIPKKLANAVPVPTISASIFRQVRLRQPEGSPAIEAVRLRNQFGRHSVKSGRLML
jgi:6-phosphogluconate dehydrogenase